LGHMEIVRVYRVGCAMCRVEAHQIVKQVRNDTGYLLGFSSICFYLLK
jgi:hypothetical protein